MRGTDSKAGVAPGDTGARPVSSGVAPSLLGDPSFRAPLLACLGLAAWVVAISALAQWTFVEEMAVLFASGPALILVAFWALKAGRPGARPLYLRLTEPFEGWGARAVWIFAAAAFVALLAIACLVLDRFPNSGDEYSFVLQAQTYASGRLWVTPPPLVEHFELNRFFAKDGKWISPYEPGWAAALAPFAALRIPLWAVSPLLGALTVGGFFALARRFLARREAWAATILLAASAFFLFTFASYFSHGAVALAGVAFALAALSYLKTGDPTKALLAGLCVGFMGFVRPFNAAIFAAPFCVALLFSPGRRIGLAWFTAGGAPFLVALLGYHWLATGDPLSPVPEWYARGAEPLGAADAQTLVESVRRLLRLGFWTSPILAGAWVVAFVELLRRKQASFIDWIMPVTVAAFVFYGGAGGNQYGPRYLFEAWPTALLTIVRGAAPYLEGRKGEGAADWVASALLASLVFQLAYLPPRLQREHQIVVERQSVYEQVRRAKLSNAVVIIAEATSPTRPMYPFDLARNGLTLDQPVIYANDRRPLNGMLRTLFPDRRFFLYEDGVLKPAAH
jgi:hypothetical protein